MGEINKKIIIISSLAAVLLISCGIYFLIESNKKIKEKETVDDKYKDILLEDCNAKICEYELITSTDTYNLIYDKQNNQHKLTLNNKEIASNGIPVQLIAFKDVFVLKYQENNYYKITAFNKDTSILFNYQFLDETSNMNITSKKMEYENNAIYVYTTKLDGNKLLKGESLVDLCNDDELLKNKIEQDDIVSGTYTIKYENNAFSKPSLKEKKTLADELITCD